MAFTNSSRRTGVKVQIFDITTVFNAASEYESHFTYYTSTTMPVVRKAKQYAYTATVSSCKKMTTNCDVL